VGDILIGVEEEPIITIFSCGVAGEVVPTGVSQIEPVKGIPGGGVAGQVVIVGGVHKVETVPIIPGGIVTKESIIVGAIEPETPAIYILIEILLPIACGYVVNKVISVRFIEIKPRSPIIAISFHPISIPGGDVVGEIVRTGESKIEPIFPIS